MESSTEKFALNEAPYDWERLGLVMPRGEQGSFDSSVTGDPCIVWDEDRGTYHMFYFAQRHEGDQEVNDNGHAVSKSPTEVGKDDWEKLGKVEYTNPEALTGETHKPWILMDAYSPNKAVKIDGKYRYYTVSFKNGRNGDGGSKIVQQAVSDSLDGPWELQEEPVIDVGAEDEFDGYHVDAVSAFWFEEQQTIIFYYKAYAKTALSEVPYSPYCSSSGVAIMGPNDTKAKKLGCIMRPSSKEGHWTHGWKGAMQILPAKDGGWWALTSASPSAPASVEEEPEMREPAPSLGGWCYTSEPWPISGWTIAEQPIEWIEDIPQEAIDAGEGVNLWRHHILALPSGELYMYYNTGSYGQEQLFGRRAKLS